MRSLTELADEYGSDKGTLGPGNAWVSHNYTDVYEAYLSRMRFNPISVLEIGVGVTGPAFQAHIQHGRNREGGASLRAWRDYFPNGRIYGVDINDASNLNEERIRTFVADQGSHDQIRNVMESSGEHGLDLVIDDGSHRPDHQQITLEALFPFLNAGGFYIIEDLADNGQNGRRKGRSSIEGIRDTRALLRDFVESGKFVGPHAISETEHLELEIERVAFHCPVIGTKRSLKRPSRTGRNPFMVRPIFYDRTHQVAVLLKRS